MIRRWLYWRELALVLSIAVNLLFAGILLGRISWMSWQDARGLSGAHQRIVDNLSPSGAAIMEKALAEVHVVFDERFREAEAASRTKSQLLTLVPFDREAFVAENRNERENFAASISQADQIIADALVSLSNDDRRALSKVRLPPPLGTPHVPRRW